MNRQGNEIDDDASDDPFGSVLESFLALFRMMLGDFERSWFESDSLGLSSFAVVLFVLYMVVVFIVMLNVG